MSDKKPTTPPPPPPPPPGRFVRDHVAPKPAPPPNLPAVDSSGKKK